MAIGNWGAKEVLTSGLQASQEEIDASGQAFTEGFLGLQALQGVATPEQVADVALLAEQVAGQPIRGIRMPFYFFLGEQEPQVVHARPAPKLSFFGIMRGLETVTPPTEADEADVLCVVVDPLTTSDVPAIRDSSYHQGRGWRTFLYQTGAVAYAEQRLWVPASGISEVTIDTGYIRDARLDVVHAQSEDELTRVAQSLVSEPTAEVPTLAI